MVVIMMESGGKWLKLGIKAVLKQFGGGSFGSSENVSLDEAELRQHNRIEKLYTSTRSCKHFQRDVVRGLEGYIVTGSKQVEIGNKMAEDSRKYGTENTCTSSNSLTKAAFSFSRARTQMVKEHEHLLRVLGTQVAEPLRALILGAPLEDARHLAQRYGRLHQEAEAQAVEVSKRRARAKEVPGNIDNIAKLEAAETKLDDLKSNMKVLGKEAASAMLTVEVQQQKQTLQRIIAMVEAERIYHQRIVQILEQLEGEMVLERQRVEASPNLASPSRVSPAPVIENQMPPPPSYEEVNGIPSSGAIDGTSDSIEFFLGEAMHSFRAESDVELSLSAGDCIVVRKVSSTGWAEGECRGNAGWFPLGHIERRERVLASKILKV
ncbi:SH3 domain-containing protein 2-like isoform X1 [Phalaenopsis equestris]|uniref:SH3 domain-containing protein 2-like isoform X1 n=1 Tax=Phalaenopsis equestris TaxID=78828 RepID=UPI0009E56047|nr:SH3 domain-containing protein 2-like isoform X1 [Phalaenopsis equestris]